MSDELDRVSVRQSSGNFNWLDPGETKWQLVLEWCINGQKGKLSALFTEQQDDEAPPSEIVDVFEERIGKRMIDSEREQNKGKIGFIRENIDRFDELWARGRIAECRVKIERLEADVESYEDFLADTGTTKREG